MTVAVLSLSQLLNRNSTLKKVFKMSQVDVLKTELNTKLLDPQKGKCLTLFVQNVVNQLRFLLNRKKVSQFTVWNTTRAKWPIAKANL